MSKSGVLQYYPSSPVLPVSVTQLAQFITVCNNRKYQATTITSFVSAIAYVHKIHQFPNPSDTFLIKKLLHALRRKSVSDSRLPFTIRHLQDITHALSHVLQDTYTIVLMRAMFLIAFFGLFRVGELAVSPQGQQIVIQHQHLKLVTEQNKVTSCSIQFNQYKHSQGQVAIIPIKRMSEKRVCPIRSLMKYLKVCRIRQGPLFQHLSGHPVTTSFFRSTLHSCVVFCHLDPTRYKTHSFRIGGATHAHLSNMSPVQIQQLGRWRSSAFLKYIRPTALSLGN